jgi:hypothetical protein
VEKSAMMEREWFEDLRPLAEKAPARSLRDVTTAGQTVVNERVQKAPARSRSLTGIFCGASCAAK